MNSRGLVHFKSSDVQKIANLFRTTERNSSISHSVTRVHAHKQGIGTISRKSLNPLFVGSPCIIQWIVNPIDLLAILEQCRSQLICRITQNFLRFKNCFHSLTPFLSAVDSRSNYRDARQSSHHRGVPKSYRILGQGTNDRD